MVRPVGGRGGFGSEASAGGRCGLLETIYATVKIRGGSRARGSWEDVMTLDEQIERLRGALEVSVGASKRQSIRHEIAVLELTKRAQSGAKLSEEEELRLIIAREEAAGVESKRLLVSSRDKAAGRELPVSWGDSGVDVKGGATFRRRGKNGPQKG